MNPELIFLSWSWNKNDQFYAFAIISTYNQVVSTEAAAECCRHQIETDIDGIQKGGGRKSDEPEVEYQIYLLVVEIRH